MILVCVIGGVGAAAAMEERDGRRTDEGKSASQDHVDMRAYEDSRWLAYAASLPVPDVPNQPAVGQEAAEEPVSEPLAAPEPEPVAEYPDTPIEAAICAYPWECGIALRVAACESGPDYMAGYNGSGHAGTFQVSPIHAWRFAARGLNFWTDATDLGANIDVAYEIYNGYFDADGVWHEGAGWSAWSCF